MRKSVSIPSLVLCVLALLPAGTALASTSPAAEEAHIVAMVNGTRVQKGLGALPRNDKLIQMARGQAARMAAKGEIFHNPNLGPEATSLGLIWHRLGENVGMGWDVDQIEQAFLDSPHHYENIVHPDYNAIGVGVAHSGDKVFVAQVFGALDQAPKVSLPIAAPEPKPSASATAPTPVVTAAPKPPTPPPALTPVSARPEPNALVDGVVSQEAVLADAGPRSASRITAVGAFLGRVLDEILPG
jgi:hypothetical protein